MGKETNEAARARFTKWSGASTPEGCTPWLGRIRANGYGQFWLNGRMASAHRTAYEFAVGPIPAGTQ